MNAFNREEYHKKYQEENKDKINEAKRKRYRELNPIGVDTSSSREKINARRREVYSKQKVINRAKVHAFPKAKRATLQTTEGTKMTQNNGPSAQLAAQALQTDLVDHEIDIDNYVKVTLSIPKKLTAIELKGIMVKANQLLKMSEVSITQGPKRTYAPRRANIEWKDELVQELVDNMAARDSDTSKTKVMRAFGEKHQITEKDIAKRYYYLMGHGMLPKTNK